MYVYEASSENRLECLVGGKDLEKAKQIKWGMRKITVKKRTYNNRNTAKRKVQKSDIITTQFVTMKRNNRDKNKETSWTRSRWNWWSIQLSEHKIKKKKIAKNTLKKSGVWNLQL